MFRAYSCAVRIELVGFKVIFGILTFSQQMIFEMFIFKSDRLSSEKSIRKMKIKTHFRFGDQIFGVEIDPLFGLNGQTDLISRI